jgi:hypothetical protein
VDINCSFSTAISIFEVQTFRALKFSLRFGYTSLDDELRHTGLAVAITTVGVGVKFYKSRSVHGSSLFDRILLAINLACFASLVSWL